MNTYEIRMAEFTDLEDILAIYATARRFMEENGNPTQWKDGYPDREMLAQDILHRRLYVIFDNFGIHGVFFFAVMKDPTYDVIEGGSWRSDEPYGVIHRIASDGSGGIFGASLAFCKKQISHIRIDTHRDNLPMQHVLEKHGFLPRGIIYVADGTPRIAYDRV